MTYIPTLDNYEKREEWLADHASWIKKVKEYGRLNGMSNKKINEGIEDKFRMSLFSSIYSDYLESQGYSRKDVAKFKMSYINSALEDYYVNEAFNNKFNPYNIQTDGTVTIDKLKGLGSQEAFVKYSQMDTQAKKELLEHPEFLTGEEIKKRYDEIIEQDKKSLKESQQYPYGNPSGLDIGARPQDRARKKLESDIANLIPNLQEKNTKIAEAIYAKDLKRKLNSSEVQKAKKAVYNQLSELSDDEVKAQFMDAILPSDSNYGNNVVRAYLNDNGELSGNLSNYSIDEMRSYLAEKKAMESVYGQGTASDYLYNKMNDYIADTDGFWHGVGVTGKRMAITFAGQFMGAINGTYNLFTNIFDFNYNVFIDKDSNVYSNKDIKNVNGKYYALKDGEYIPVTQTTLSWAELNAMGKNPDGSNKLAIFNDQYWNRAERFNVWNPDLQKEYEQLNYSPHTSHYDSEDENQINYLQETLVMSAFVAETLAETFLLKGVGKAGKVGAAVSKVGTAIQPYASAEAIGHAYARNNFAENLSLNMTKLQQKTSEDAINNIRLRYYNDPEYKQTIDDEIERRMQQKMQTAPPDAKTVYFTDALKNQYTQEVLQEQIDTEYDRLLQSEDYLQAEKHAIKNSTQAALTMEITDATKYAFVNKFGYRKYFFNKGVPTAEQVRQKYGKMLEYLKNGKVKLKDVSTLKYITKGFAKNAISGGLTNYTDELQAAGAKNMNNSTFDAFLNGYYNAAGDSVSIGQVTGISAFMDGFLENVFSKSSIDASIIGATGSVFSIAPNLVGLANLTTKTGREHWRSLSRLEKIHEIVNIGLLNPTLELKQQRDIYNSIAKQVNELIENNKDTSIYKALQAMELAEVDLSTLVDSKDEKVSALAKMQSDFLRELGAIISLREIEAASPARGAQRIAELLELIDAVENESLTDEQLNGLLEDYYAENKSISKSEENNAKAIEQIKTRAARLKEVLQQYDQTKKEVKTRIGQADVQSSDIFSIDELTRYLTFKKLWKNQLETKYQELSQILGTQVSDINSRVYGSKKAIEDRQSVLSINLNAVDAEIQRIEVELNSTQDQLKKLQEKQEADPTELNKVRELKQKELTYKLLLQDYKQQRRLVEEKQKNYETISNTIEENNNTLSVEEIQGLSFLEQAILFDTANKKYYTQEQQKNIEEAKKKLGNEKVEQIMLLAALHNQLETLNRNDFSLEEEALLFQNTLFTTYNAQRYFAYHNLLSIIEKTIQDNTPEETVMPVLLKYNTSILKTVLQNPKLYPKLNKFSTQIQQALEAREEIDLIISLLNNIEGDESAKKIIIETLYSVRQKSHIAETLNQLQKTYPTIIKELLESLNQIEDLKHIYEEALTKGHITQSVAPKAVNTKRISNPNTLLGNVLAFHNPKKLANEHVIEERIPYEKGNTLDQAKTVFENDDNFVNVSGSEEGQQNKLQEVIDFELNNLVSSDTDIYFVTHKDAPDVVFSCIEYTDAVAKKHNKGRGCVIQVIDSGGNSKQYLVIGSIGYGDYSGNVQSFNAFREQLTYSQDKPWTITEGITSKITQINKGQYTQTKNEDGDPVWYSLSELIEQHNPWNLTYQDLVDQFYITTLDKEQETLKRQTLNKNLVFPTTYRSGSVVLYLRTAAGDKLPVAIKSVLLTDSKISNEFKQKVYQNILNLLDKSKRKEALEFLNKYIVLNSKQNEWNITVENEQVCIKNNRTTLLKTDNLEKLVLFIRSENFNPRMQLSNELLSDASAIKELAENGVIQLDVNQLAFVGASFEIDNPIIKKEETQRKTTYKGYTRNTTTGEVKMQHQKNTYRHEGQKWMNTNTEEEADSSVSTLLDVHYKIITENTSPVATTNKGDNIFIIQDRESNEYAYIEKASGLESYSLDAAKKLQGQQTTEKVKKERVEQKKGLPEKQQEITDDLLNGRSEQYNDAEYDKVPDKDNQLQEADDGDGMMSYEDVLTYESFDITDTNGEQDVSLYELFAYLINEVNAAIIEQYTQQYSLTKWQLMNALYEEKFKDKKLKDLKDWCDDQKSCRI